MGCDIHLYLEKRNKLGKWENSEYTKNGLHYIWRCYPLFARMANVRNYWDLDHMPVRGFPINASIDVKKAFFSEIVSTVKYDKLEKEDFPINCVKYENAIRYLSEDKHINPFYIADNGDLFMLDKDYVLGKMLIPNKVTLGNIYITDDDYHSANCLTYEEYAKCLYETLKEESINQTGWTDLLRKMEEYKKEGTECRIVFWFDN